MLCMAIFPLWWSYFSETVGRRSVYLVSFSCFVLFAILSAVSTSIGMFVAMRMLSGGAAASVQTVGAGTLSDIWEPKERGKAMGFFYIGSVCGPLLAPIIGGALGEKWGWRSTQWFLVIYGGVSLVFLLLALPETSKRRKALVEDVPSTAGPALERTSSHQAVPRKTQRWIHALHQAFVEPLKIVLWLRFPAILITVYYSSIGFGSLYVLNISLQDVFSKPPYNFPTWVVGLIYIPSSLGFLVSSLFGGKWSDYIMARGARKANRYDEKGGLIYIPEDRMGENAWIAAVLFPVSMLVYGWTAGQGVHWIVPVSVQISGRLLTLLQRLTDLQLIANFFFGCSTMVIFSLALTMLTEFIPQKPSNGVAANNFLRNIFSCVGSTIADPMIRAIGNGWTFTILGMLGFFSISIVWLMKHMGPRWREAMTRKIGP